MVDWDLGTVNVEDCSVCGQAFLNERIHAWRREVDLCRTSMGGFQPTLKGIDDGDCTVFAPASPKAL